MENSAKVAVVQASPILFEVHPTIDKLEKLANEAAQNGATLVLFPETFISVYPRGLSFGTVVGSRSKDGRETWLQYWNSAIHLPSDASLRLRQIAKDHHIYLVVGITEQSTVGGTLYCTLLYVDPSGQIIGKHRKVKPTAAERIIWGEGNGKDIEVYDTPLGKIGGLICWENYMPLARLALYQQGVELYLAPTADSRDGWVASMQHIALEGRCYVLSSNQFVKKDQYPKELIGRADLENQPDIMCRGGSLIVDPLGKIIAGPLYNTEGILYADIDKATIIKSKLDFDVVGHYGVKSEE